MEELFPSSSGRQSQQDNWSEIEVLDYERDLCSAELDPAPQT